MSVGLIYGKAFGRLRKVVINGNPAPHVAPGEALINISDDQYAALHDIGTQQSHVNSVTGMVPSGDRAVTVDSIGNVLAVHFADPGCDKPLPGTTLVGSNIAQPGWMFVGQRFVAFPAIPPHKFKASRVFRRLARN